MLHNCSMQNDTSRSDEILTAFADALFERQLADLDTAERGLVVELDLADLMAPRAVAGPPRAPRKHAP